MSELDQPPFGSPARKHRDDVDGFGDERTRNGNDRFLYKLLKPPQGAERGAGVDRSNPARVASAPGLQKIKSFGTANLADRNAVRPKT